jgi:uncharacterized membrane protein
MTTARAAIAGAALLWIGLAVLAPYAESVGSPLGALLYDAFHRVCHQIPERSFVLFGHPLAACHRCTGLYAGFLAGVLLLPATGPVREALGARPRLAVLFFIPMVVDAVLLPGNTPATRFLTGLVAALPVGLMAFWAAGQLFGPAAPSQLVPGIAAPGGER